MRLLEEPLIRQSTVAVINTWSAWPSYHSKYNTHGEFFRANSNSPELYHNWIPVNQISVKCDFLSVYKLIWLMFWGIIHWNSTGNYRNSTEFTNSCLSLSYSHDALSVGNCWKFLETIGCMVWTVNMMLIWVIRVNDYKTHCLLLHSNWTLQLNSRQKPTELDGKWKHNEVEVVF